MDKNNPEVLQIASTSNNVQSETIICIQSALCDVSDISSIFRNSEDLSDFERYVFQQGEELKIYKKKYGQASAALSKFQEDKRSLELQLSNERIDREQDFKKVQCKVEKNNAQVNAHLYTIKYEAENWKWKYNAAIKESELLKEQIKAVEKEKVDAIAKLTKSSSGGNSDWNHFRASVEIFIKQQKDYAQDVIRVLSELKASKEVLESINEANAKQVKTLEIELRNQIEATSASEKTIAELERELITTKAENAQSNAKLSRSLEMETSYKELVSKLTTENKNLHEGVNILSGAIDKDIDNGGREMISFLNEFHERVIDSAHRLCMTSAEDNTSNL